MQLSELSQMDVTVSLLQLWMYRNWMHKFCHNCLWGDTIIFCNWSSWGQVFTYLENIYINKSSKETTSILCDIAKCCTCHPFIEINTVWQPWLILLQGHSPSYTAPPFLLLCITILSDLNFIVQHFIILHLLNCHFCVYLIIYCSISKFYISSLSHNWQSYIATISYILMSKQQKDIDAVPKVLRGDRGGLGVATWPESRPSTLNLNTVKTFTLNFTFKDL